MTDEQITSALEGCGICGNHHCDEGCPCFRNGINVTSMCRRNLIIEAHDLIKRQQAEIEDLIKQRDEQLRINRQVVRRNGKHVDERNRLKSKLEKEVDLNRELFEKMAKDEAEIERLEADREALINGQITLQKMYAEAIKKFAEKIKERKYQSSDWSHGEHPFVVEEDDIDDVLWKMTEGSNGE